MEIGNVTSYAVTNAAQCLQLQLLWIKRYDTERSGKMDLIDFTDVIRQLCGNRLTDIEIEIMFARFAGDQGT